MVNKKYTDIDNVITIKSIGLNSTGDVVTLDANYSSYYVYIANMEYIGQSNELLSTKYYLANRMLDIQHDNESEDDLNETSIKNPSSGGDNTWAMSTTIPVPVYSNPSFFITLKPPICGRFQRIKWRIN